MNGIEDLRSTLDRHAADVVDHDLGGRVGSVHQRVRVVRRQRRAGAAGALAATLAVVGSVALLAEPSPRKDLPPATVVGLPVPSSMKALGYTYGFDRSVEGDDKATVKLDDSDTPRLVSWGTAGEDDRVRVTQSGDVAAYDVPDFSDFVWVGPGDGISVSVAGAGAVGLAVYELTDEQPEGVTGGGVTYREEIAGDRLLGASVGEPGESEVRVSTSEADGVVSYRVFCANGPKNATVHVDDGWGGMSGSGCSEGIPFDPGAGTAYSVGESQSSDLSVRVWVTAGRNGPLLDSDEVVLGLGVYAEAPTSRVSGFEVEPIIENSGHLWQRSTIRLSDPGDRRLEVAGGDVPMLALGFHQVDNATIVMEHSGTGETVQSNRVAIGHAVIGLLAGPGDEASVRVTDDVPEDARLAIALYERLD